MCYLSLMVTIFGLVWLECSQKCLIITFAIERYYYQRTKIIKIVEKIAIFAKHS